MPVLPQKKYLLREAMIRLKHGGLIDPATGEPFTSGYNTRTLRKLIDSGQLKTVRVASKEYVTEEAIRAFEAQ